MPVYIYVLAKVLMINRKVSTKELLKDGELLVFAIDPGTKNLAFSFNLVRLADENTTTDNFSLLLRLKKYTSTFYFKVTTLFTSIAEVDDCQTIHKLISTYKPHFLKLLVDNNGRQFILPILTIERFVYYGRKSIKLLEKFNKIIGCLQYAALDLFDFLATNYAPALNSAVYEVTYKQWFSELAKQVEKLNDQYTLSQLKRKIKKQKKDTLLFKSLYGLKENEQLDSNHISLAFSSIGDHTFDTFLLTAYGVYKTI